jgi:hypothetical protein
MLLRLLCWMLVKLHFLQSVAMPNKAALASAHLLLLLLLLLFAA